MPTPGQPRRPQAAGRDDAAVARRRQTRRRQIRRRQARRRQIRRRRITALTTFAALVAIVILAADGEFSGGPHEMSGHRATKAADVRDAKAPHTRDWRYVNPLQSVSRLQPGRIDMGVDYAGSGPVAALGEGTVTMASNHDSGPPRCWGKTCWPAGGIVVYRLSAGPLAGKYVYVAENITVHVATGDIVRPGEAIATAHDASPHIETGWASGKGPETLAIADRHQCPWGDPGGWSSIEGRNFDRLLVVLGAPSAYLQPKPPNQSMPSGWPMWPGSGAGATPRSSAPLGEGSTATSSSAPSRR